MEIFTVDMDALSYSRSALVNAAVERKFEIIGEALNQLSKCDTVIATKIPGVSKILAFGNHLIHAYAGIESTLVCNVVQRSLPDLRMVVTMQLRESDSIQ